MQSVSENQTHKTDDFTPPIYNVWKKQTKSNTTSHFGNSESEWVDNLKQNRPKDQNDTSVNQAEKLAEQYGKSSATVKRAGKFAEEVEKSPELQKAIAEGIPAMKVKKGLQINARREDNLKQNLPKRHLVGSVWQAEQKRIADEANAKRSAATKAQPRSESGHFDTTGLPTSSGETGRNRSAERELETSAAKDRENSAATTCGSTVYSDPKAKTSAGARNRPKGHFDPSVWHPCARGGEVGLGNKLPAAKVAPLCARE